MMTAVKTARSLALVSGLAVGVLLVPGTSAAQLLEVPHAKARPTCRDFVVDTSYTCTAKLQRQTTTNGHDRVVDVVQLDGATATFTDFTEDRNPLGAFVMTLAVPGQGVRTTYCSCEAEGSFKKPSFGVSQDLISCLGGFGEDQAFMAEGQLGKKGRTIQGQLWFIDPFFDAQPGNGQFVRGVLECERND